jgi:hypothetical protein
MNAESFVLLEGERWMASESSADMRVGSPDNRQGLLIVFTSDSGRQLSAAVNRPLAKHSEAELADLLARCITWEQDG